MTTSTALSPISSADAARTFLAVGGEMSSMKLQKLIYLAHENHIRETGKPLIQGDVIEAWDEGPVFRDLYRLIGNSENGKVIPEDLPDSNVVDDAREYIEAVNNVFNDNSGSQLSRITHVRGSPWRMARKTVRRGGFFSWLFNVPIADKPVISNSMIRHYCLAT